MSPQALAFVAKVRASRYSHGGPSYAICSIGVCCISFMSRNFLSHVQISGKLVCHFKGAVFQPFILATLELTVFHHRVVVACITARPLGGGENPPELLSALGMHSTMYVSVHPSSIYTLYHSHVASHSSTFTSFALIHTEFNTPRDGDVCIDVSRRILFIG